MTAGEPRTVVVGHGMVGHRFVESPRRRDPDGDFRVVLRAEESRPAYDRVALSSYLGGTSEADLALADVAFLRCLEDADVAVATYPVRVVSGVVEVGRP